MLSSCNCKKSLIILLFLHSFVLWGYTQSNTLKTGNWMIYNASFPLYDKFGGLVDIQLRNRTGLINPETALFRFGVDYKFPRKMATAIGYAHIINFYADSNAILSYENRTWEQFTFSKQIGRVVFDNRMRVEQRWITNKKTTYYNRIRYKLHCYIPINKPTFEAGTFFVSLYDEIFYQLKESPFDRNRLYGAVGLQLNNNFSFQLGYLNQTTQNDSRNFLQFLLANKF